MPSLSKTKDWNENLTMFFETFRINFTFKLFFITVFNSGNQNLDSKKELEYKN